MGPPHICVVKKNAHLTSLYTWCGRDISISSETRYDIDTALEKGDPITCLRCIEEIRSATHPHDVTPMVDLGWQEMLLPFVAMGLFLAGVVLNKEYGYQFRDTFWLCIASVVLMGYVAGRMLYHQRQCDRIGQKRMDALLKESPNK